MPAEKKSFINVDELMPRVGVEQAAAYYGAALPELKRVGAEVRTRCFLNCGRTCETGENAGGRPRGERFKQIAVDLKAMAEGVVRPEGALAAPAVKAAAKPKPEN